MEIAPAIISLSFKAVSVSKELHDLRTKYKDAAAAIDAIYKETEVMRASLSQVQRLLEKDHAKDYQFDDELREYFDTAITGCAVVLSCLENETNKLAKSASEGSGFGWRAKAMYLWKEEIMSDLLQKLRGQQGAITLLLQSLQIEMLSDLRHFLHTKSGEVSKSEAEANALRKAHPEAEVPESLLGHKDDADSVLGDRASVISSIEFLFDDEIVNSKEYQRVLLSAAGQRARPKSPALDYVPKNEGDDSVKTPRGSSEVPALAAEDATTPPALEEHQGDMRIRPSRGDDGLTTPTYADPSPAYEPPLSPCSQTQLNFPVEKSITLRSLPTSSLSPSLFSTQSNISPSGSPTLSADPFYFTSRSLSPSPSPPFHASRTPSPELLSAAMNKALRSLSCNGPPPDPCLASCPLIPAITLPRLVDELGTEQMDSATDRESSATDTSGRSTPEHGKPSPTAMAETMSTDAAPSLFHSSTSSTPTPKAYHYQMARRNRGDSLSKLSAKAEARAEARAAARAKRADKRAMRRGSAQSFVHSPTSPSAGVMGEGDDVDGGYGSPTSRPAARRLSSSGNCSRRDRGGGGVDGANKVTWSNLPPLPLDLERPPLPPLPSLPRVSSLPISSNSDFSSISALRFPPGLARRATSMGVGLGASDGPCKRRTPAASMARTLTGPRRSRGGGLRRRVGSGHGRAGGRGNKDWDGDGSEAGSKVGPGISSRHVGGQETEARGVSATL